MRDGGRGTDLEMCCAAGAKRSLDVSCAVWGEIVVALTAALGGHVDGGDSRRDCGLVVVTRREDEGADACDRYRGAKGTLSVRG